METTSWVPASFVELSWPADLGSKATLMSVRPDGGLWYGEVNVAGCDDVTTGSCSAFVKCDTPGGEYVVLVGGMTSARLTIASPPGNCEVTTPNSGSSYPVGGTVDVTWNPDNAPTVTDFTSLELAGYDTNNPTIRDTYGKVAGPFPNSGSFSFTIPDDVEPGKYSIELKFFGSNANRKSLYSEDFTISSSSFRTAVGMACYLLPLLVLLAF